MEENNTGSRSDDSAWRTQPCIPKEEEMVEDENKIGAYEIIQRLGRGEFAEVYLVRDTRSLSDGLGGSPEEESEYAAKCISKKRVQSHADVRRRLRAIKRINNEIEAIKKTRHPNICALYHVYHSPTHIYLVVELGGTDLYNTISRKAKGFDFGLTLRIGSQMGSAIAHLESRLIAHRDIKPENILIKGDIGRTDSIEVKLCDFGLCGLAKVTKGLTNWEMSDFVGSPGFFAPEILACDVYDARKVDIWSLGCVMLEMLQGHDLFEHDWLNRCYNNQLLHDINAFLAQLRKATSQQIYHIPKRTARLKSILEQLLIISPIERISATGLIDAFEAADHANQEENDGFASPNSPSRKVSFDSNYDPSEGRRLAIHTTPCAKIARTLLATKGDSGRTQEGDGVDDDDNKSTYTLEMNSHDGTEAARKIHANAAKNLKLPSSLSNDCKSSSREPKKLLNAPPQIQVGSPNSVSMSISPVTENKGSSSSSTSRRISWNIPTNSK